MTFICLHLMVHRTFPESWSIYPVACARSAHTSRRHPSALRKVAYRAAYSAATDASGSSRHFTFAARLTASAYCREKLFSHALGSTIGNDA